MPLHPLAGKPAPANLLIDRSQLERDYYERKPDVSNPNQLVSFGTSGHRGTPTDSTFTEAHIVAIAQAICEWRRDKGVDGPLYIGKDTHAVSTPAQRSALEVFAANGAEVFIQQGDGATPTPVISHAILTYNKGRTANLADGVVITPSHNPPTDGGFKYNPPNGGPADTDATGWIEKTANEFIKAKLKGVKRMPYAQALNAACIHRYDYVTPYVKDLGNVVDLELVREAGVKIGIDPLGGAAVHFWAPIIERYKIDATVVNEAVDPTFRFMTADWDGKVRMDCSSPYAMKS